jgi:hypothetical protein
VLLASGCMKLPLVFALALSAPAFAGTTAKEAIVAPAEPSLWSWFAGASVGQLNDFDESMYHGHVGADTPWSVGGWDIALFGELGQTEGDLSGFAPFEPIEIPQLTVNAVAGYNNRQSLEIMPLTFNVKLERPIYNNFSAYVGAGVGVAFVDYTAKVPGLSISESDSDTVLAAQVFAGVVYNATSNVEIYGGARWIYVDYDAPSVPSVPVALSFDEDVLFELGLRYNF